MSTLSRSVDTTGSEDRQHSEQQPKQLGSVCEVADVNLVPELDKDEHFACALGIDRDFSRAHFRRGINNAHEQELRKQRAVEQLA